MAVALSARRSKVNIVMFYPFLNCALCGVLHIEGKVSCCVNGDGGEFWGISINWIVVDMVI